MFRMIGLLSVLAGLCAAGEAWGQTELHRDGRGYTQQIGNTTGVYRDGALVATRVRSGRTEEYRYANGTVRSVVYGDAGRLEKETRADGSIQVGFFPYQNQSPTGQPLTGQFPPAIPSLPPLPALPGLAPLPSLPPLTW